MSTVQERHEPSVAELRERAAAAREAAPAKAPAKKQQKPPEPEVIVGKVQATEPYMSIELVDVERAHHYLGLNTRNRSVSKPQVRELATAMEQDKFLFDGSPVRISHSGVLLDGQHRLHAIIMSEKPQKLVIWHNIADEAQYIMDTGRKRTVADSLRLQGEKDPNVLGAALAAAYRWDQGVRGWQVASGSQRVSIQTPMLMQYLDEHPEIRNGLRAASRVRGISRVSSSMLAFAYYLFERIDENSAEDAAAFFQKLENGEGLNAGDPILTLRQQWIRMAANRDLAPKALYLAQIIRAWNAWRDGEKIWKFSIRLGGNSPSDFPEPH